MTTYCLFVVLGAICSLLLNLNEAKALKNFSWKAFVKQNWLATLTNVIVGCAIVACTYDSNEFFTMTKLSAFILGAVAQQFVKKLCNIFLAGKPTYIGFNKQTQNTYDTEDNVEP